MFYFFLFLQLVKQAVVPRVHGLALKTTVAAVCFLCFLNRVIKKSSKRFLIITVQNHYIHGIYSGIYNVLPFLQIPLFHQFDLCLFIIVNWGNNFSFCLQVRVNALLCLSDMIHMLDKHSVLEILQTIQRCTAVDRSAPTLMCTLGVANSILKQVLYTSP